MISGFGSKISINHDDSIDFYVTTIAPSFTIDIFRTGNYQGIGARLVQSLGSFIGVHQAISHHGAVLPNRCTNDGAFLNLGGNPTMSSHFEITHSK